MTWAAVAAAATILAALGPAAGSAIADQGSGAVYTLTNSAAGNAVVVLDRAANGTLSPAGTFPTGGLGSGNGLGSQGALVLGDDGRRLYAVNPGSSEISAFAVQNEELALISKVSSGGVRPISLTVSRGLIYVLNAGSATTPGNIAGFKIRNRELSPLAGSSRPLSADSVGPAQIQFNPSGRVLVVTEKATNLIDTYVVGEGGLTSGPIVQPSAGATPFGFDFDHRGHLIVSDAFGGASGQSALSSYSLSSDGTLSAITPLAPDGQTAACWVVVTKNGRYAYTTNTGSNNVSSYTIGADGSLTLLNGVAGTTGQTPADAALARNSRFLYALNVGSNAISSFEVEPDGRLVPLAGLAGLPAGSVGLAAQ